MLIVGRWMKSHGTIEKSIPRVDALAMVIGKARNLSKVGYQDLQPVLTVETALYPQAPLLYPEIDTYFRDFSYERSGNVCADASDVGQAINCQDIEGQIEGGAIQRDGYGLVEELFIERGEMKNPSLSTFLIPTAVDAPKTGTPIIGRLDPNGPFAAQGVGEPPSMMPMPALANAILDATDVRLNEILMIPKKLFGEGNSVNGGTHVE